MTTTAYRSRWISLPALAVECVVCRNYLTSLAMPAGFRNCKSVVHVLLLWKTPKTRIKEGKNDQDRILAKARVRARTSKGRTLGFLVSVGIGTVSIALLPGKSPQPLDEAGRDGHLETTLPEPSHFVLTFGSRTAFESTAGVSDDTRSVDKSVSTFWHLVARFATAM